MISASIRDFKNNLSRYLFAIRQGEQVRITDRGQPVARLVQESSTTDGVQAKLAELAALGIITRPTQPHDEHPAQPQVIPGAKLSAAVLSDRR